jgi:pimeloyl-ACP methyl ester carboxylesterase
MAGGWCWKRVTPLLRAAGHEVYIVTLTGLGERAHLLHPGIDLDTHIQDVIGLLAFEDLHDVVLVGHSYGTSVIAGVVDRVPERLAHRVFLDGTGALATDGQSMADHFPPAVRAARQAQVDTAGDGWRWPPEPEFPMFIERFGLNESDAAWLRAKLVPQPWKAVTQPLRLTNPAGPRGPKTFIACVGAGQSPARDARFEPLRTAPGWRYRELATGHMAMITAPRELTDLLLECAQVVDPAVTESEPRPST